MNERGQGVILITKANGDRVPFDPKKLERSMRRAGATQKQMTEIVDEIQAELVEGLKTHKIYRKAFGLLCKKSKGIAVRYKIKKALFELGPAGYTFEKFLAKVFQKQGSEAETNIYLQGKCIQHEVDVRGENEDEIIYVECTFHNSPGAKTDVRTPLYLKSHFDDILAGNGVDKRCRSILVTNTRFTEDAITFGRCLGIELISWDYPQNGNLKDLIERSGHHPITSLASLGSRQKNHFIERGVIVAREILQNESLMLEMGMNKSKLRAIEREVDLLLNGA